MEGGIPGDGANLSAFIFSIYKGMMGKRPGKKGGLAGFEQLENGLFLAYTYNSSAPPARNAS
jgi:hypothetical protein